MRNCNYCSLRLYVWLCSNNDKTTNKKFFPTNETIQHSWFFAHYSPRRLFDVYRRLYQCPPWTSSDMELMRRRPRPLDWCVHVHTPDIRPIQSVFLMLFCLFGDAVFQSSFIGAIAIGDLVKSTLGPKGMVRNTVTCAVRSYRLCAWPLTLLILWPYRTKSYWATVVKSQWPMTERRSWKPSVLITLRLKCSWVRTADISSSCDVCGHRSHQSDVCACVSDMSKVQDDEVGDGTTSVTVLAAELLRVRDKELHHHSSACLSSHRSSNLICVLWRRKPSSWSPRRFILRSSSPDGERPLKLPVTPSERQRWIMGNETSLLSSGVTSLHRLCVWKMKSLSLFCRNDDAKFQLDLINIARTTLSSKLVTHHKDHFTNLAVEAVLRLRGSGNLEAIHIIKKLGGSLTDSYLDEGAHVHRALWSHEAVFDMTLKNLLLVNVCDRISVG